MVKEVFGRTAGAPEVGSDTLGEPVGVDGHLSMIGFSRLGCLVGSKVVSFIKGNKPTHCLGSGIVSNVALNFVEVNAVVVVVSIVDVAIVPILTV